MSRKRIFYVDDDPDDRQIMEETFQQLGQQVDLQLFNDGLDLVKYLNNNPGEAPCLIILDLNMPKLDGKDTLRLLRDNPKYEATPVVIFTTSSLPADSYFARHYKAGFITKPIDLHHMKSIVKQFFSYCKEDEKKTIDVG